MHEKHLQEIPIEDFDLISTISINSELNHNQRNRTTQT